MTHGANETVTVDRGALETLVDEARYRAEELEDYRDHVAAIDSGEHGEVSERIAELDRAIAQAQADLAQVALSEVPDGPELTLVGDWLSVLEGLYGWVVGLHLEDGRTVDLLVTDTRWDDRLRDIVWLGVDVTEDDTVALEVTDRTARLRLDPDTAVPNVDVVAHELY